MGKGIDLAKGLNPDMPHAQIIDDFKDQLIVVLLKRLKNKYKDNLSFPVAEVDNTYQDIVSFSIKNNAFNFKLEKKS